MEEKAIVKFTTYKNNAPARLKSSRFLTIVGIIIGIMLGIGAIIWNPLHAGIIDNSIQTSEQPTLQSAGFDVKTVDAELKVNAEIVSKNGIEYEILCKNTAARKESRIETYECELDDLSKPILKEITNSTTLKLQNITTGYSMKLSTCERLVYYEKTYCSEKTGEVKVGDRIISKDNYICGAGYCVTCKDSYGGGVDGNCDLIIQPGESNYVSFEELL